MFKHDRLQLKHIFAQEIHHSLRANLFLSLKEVHADETNFAGVTVVY